MKYPETKIFGLALLIAGLVLCGFSLWWLLSPPQFQATAGIKVEPNQPPSGSSMDFDPYFIQATLEIMQSEVVLTNVISALDLNNKWGIKYNHGAPFKLNETLSILKGKLIFAPVRNTKLVNITAKSDDPKEAADIANATADAYKNYRIASMQFFMAIGLKTLEDDYQTKEKEIQTWQTNVDELRKKLGIPDTSDSATVSEPTFPQMNEALVEDARIYLQSSNQLQELKSDDAKKLRADLLAISHDQPLMNLLNKLSKTERSYESLTNNQQPAAAETIRTQTRLNTLNQQIDSRVAGLMAGLESILKSEQAALDFLRNDIKEAQPKYLADLAKNQPYYDAKIKLEQMEAQQRLFKAKIDAQKIDAATPKTSLVQIVDPALPPKFPIGPNHFLAGGLLALGLVLAFGGILLLKPEE